MHYVCGKLLPRSDGSRVSINPQVSAVVSQSVAFVRDRQSAVYCPASV
jgi:hypothetical protein